MSRDPSPNSPWLAATHIADRYRMPGDYEQRRMVLKGDFMSWAITSHDDRFRFLLGRQWLMPTDQQKVLCAIGVNPSRARHIKGDHTITKLIKFGQLHGCSNLVMMNLFSWSDKDPAGLVRADRDGINIVGHSRDFYTEIARLLPHRIALCMWGKTPKAISLAAQRQKCRVTEAFGSTVCFGMNLDMSPRHPLRLAYATPLVKYT